MTLAEIVENKALSFEELKQKALDSARKVNADPDLDPESGLYEIGHDYRYSPEITSGQRAIAMTIYLDALNPEKDALLENYINGKRRLDKIMEEERKKPILPRIKPSSVF